MKYQFQFAGAAASQAKAQPRKSASKRTMVLGGAMLLLSAAACYQYFFRMHPVAPVAGPAGQTVAAAPVAVKQVAETSAKVVSTLVAEASKAPVVAATEAVPQATPVEVAVKAPAPVVPAVSAAQALPVKTAAEPFKIVPVPPAQRVARELTPEQQMTVAGQESMDNMLKMASSYPDAYGFGPTDMFAEAKLGKPIQVFTIDEKDRAAYKSGRPVKPILKPAKQWVYPVMVGERICCMVQVSNNGRAFVPGGASKALALAWNKINQLWPESDGYHPVLVVNPRIPSFYFSIPEADTPNITDTVQMLYYNPSLSPADVILASWR